MELNEGKRDEALRVFIPMLQKYGINTNVSQLKQFLLNKFVTEAGIHHLSLSSNFYLIGIARYYFEGNITKNTYLNIMYPKVKDKFIPEICQRLDALVGVLRGMYIDSVGTKFEQPEDFGNLSIEALLKKYNKAINKVLGIANNFKETPVEKKQQVSKSNKSGKNYTYDILYSYEDAKKYKIYTEPGAWCITYGKQHYENYVKRLGIHYIIFKRDGFENILRKKGKNWTKQKPQDEYGNSLIAVLQSNKNGEPIYITSRWNHGTEADNTQCEADHAYTKEEFFKVTGCNDDILQRAFEQWKENNNEKKTINRRSELYAKKLDILRSFKYIQMLINGGADPFEFLECKKVIREAKEHKGTYLVFIEKDGNYHFTLMDRKRLFYDKFIVESMWGNLAEVITNKFCLLSDDGQKNHYLFDFIHHDFVTLDGYYKFKKINDEIKWHAQLNEINNNNYCLLALSGNQIALLNLQTLKPVKAKNGTCWFESITGLYENKQCNIDLSGNIYLPYYLDEKVVLKLIYDSAANEIYLFDILKNKFIEIKNDNDGYTLARFQKKNTIGLIEYCKKNSISGEEWLSRFQRASNNEWFEVGGYTTFKELIISDSLVVGYKGHDENVAHYIDGKTGKYLEIEGKEVITKNVAMQLNGKWLVISLTRDEKTIGDFWLKCILFNTLTRTIYHDNISGWYFSIYGYDYGGGGFKVYHPMSKELYRTPSPEKIAQEEVVDNYNDMLNRMNKFN